jgi:hypothetical protein
MNERSAVSELNRIVRIERIGRTASPRSFGTPLSVDLPCVLPPRVHSPLPAYSELHHVIPQAWQLRAQIEQTKDARVPAGWVFKRALFDPRTAAVCPTHHRNVHRWLVRLMRAISDAYPGDFPITGTHVLDVRQLVLRDFGLRSNSIRYHEVRMAAEAPLRWTMQGGDARFLVEHALWGEA